MLNEGSMRYVCYGSGCAWKGEVVNEKLWFLSRASEKVADPRGVVAKGAVRRGYLSRLWCFEVGKPKARVMMMVIIVEVLSFLPKIKTEKMRAVKKVSERFVVEQCAETDEGG